MNTRSTSVLSEAELMSLPLVSIGSLVKLSGKYRWAKRHGTKTPQSLQELINNVGIVLGTNVEKVYHEYDDGSARSELVHTVNVLFSDGTIYDVVLDALRCVA